MELEKRGLSRLDQPPARRELRGPPAHRGRGRKHQHRATQTSGQGSRGPSARPGTTKTGRGGGRRHQASRTRPRGKGHQQASSREGPHQGTRALHQASSRRPGKRGRSKHPSPRHQRRDVAIYANRTAHQHRRPNRQSTHNRRSTGQRSPSRSPRPRKAHHQRTTHQRRTRRRKRTTKSRRGNRKRTTNHKDPLERSWNNRLLGRPNDMKEREEGVERKAVLCLVWNPRRPIMQRNWGGPARLNKPLYFCSCSGWVRSPSLLWPSYTCCLIRLSLPLLPSSFEGRVAGGEWEPTPIFARSARAQAQAAQLCSLEPQT